MPLVGGAVPLTGGVTGKVGGGNGNGPQFGGNPKGDGGGIPYPGIDGCPNGEKGEKGENCGAQFPIVTIADKITMNFMFLF